MAWETAEVKSCREEGNPPKVTLLAYFQGIAEQYDTSESDERRWLEWFAVRLFGSYHDMCSVSDSFLLLQFIILRIKAECNFNVISNYNKKVLI